MSGNKKQRTTEETYTQAIPVVSFCDETQAADIMHLCGIPRSLTSNKLRSLQGWGLVLLRGSQKSKIKSQK